MSDLQVKVTSKKEGRTEVFQGTVLVTGLKPTKLVRSDGSTVFPNRSAVLTVARSVARRLGATGVTAVETGPSKKARQKQTN